MKKWGRFIILALMLLIVLAFYRMTGTKHQADSPSASGRNAEQTAEITQALKPFGCTLTIPKGMAIARKVPDFLWFTDNGAGIMRNICLYSYPAEAMDTALVIQKRDSVMKRNMPGEEPQMYMKTEEKLPVSHRWDTDGMLRTNGWWEMEGDMMGGPFVSHSRLDKKRCRIVVAEAFLYAPDRDKEVALQRLEEALQTLRME